MAQWLRSGRFYHLSVRVISACIVVLLPAQSHADEEAGAWRWYYVAYGAPGPNAKLFTRSGHAIVLANDSVVKIEMQEHSSGETSSFVGKVRGTHVAGKLMKFFPSGEETQQGEYREKQTLNCKWQQFSIRPEYPDGSILIVSRVEGPCQ